MTAASVREQFFVEECNSVTVTVTYFTFFSDFEKHEFIRFFRNDVSKKCKKSHKVSSLLNVYGSAPRYLGPLVPVADLQGRRTLRSAGTSRLVVPSVRLSTVGSRAFPVAGPRIWNALPEETTSAPWLTSFRQHLKTWLFSQSYPDLII